MSSERMHTYMYAYVAPLVKHFKLKSNNDVKIRHDYK